MKVSLLPGKNERLRNFQRSRNSNEDYAQQGRDFFVGQTSEQSRTLRSEIARVARRPFNILITGETGTGKTHAAREIHRLSARSNAPFVELNCANLPEHLVEAELFGYRKGAFTGADRDHKGLFEEADGGILFLDEIGDAAPAVQNKLLRAIDEKQIKRLGANHSIFCDVQIIAATSRNLAQMIQAGQFREDLYCRLAILTIETIPLREHREDIPAMVAFFLREAAEAVAGQSMKPQSYLIDESAMAILYEYDYPGNIRSLRNLIYELTSYVDEDEAISVELVHSALTRLNARRAIKSGDERKVNLSVVKDSTLSGKDKTLEWGTQISSLRSIVEEGDIILPLELCVLRRAETFKQWTARAKRYSIEAALRAHGGSMREVAQRLGLTRSSLKGHLRRAKELLIQNEVGK